MNNSFYNSRSIIYYVFSNIFLVQPKKAEGGGGGGAVNKY